MSWYLVNILSNYFFVNKGSLDNTAGYKPTVVSDRSRSWVVPENRYLEAFSAMKVHQSWLNWELGNMYLF